MPVVSVNFLVLARKKTSSGIDELGGAQHAQGSTLLDLEAGGFDIGGRHVAVGGARAH